ncbi:MAG TPA: HpsJ family protein [Coleofasciculaceae cyanobacterium]
MRAVSPSSTSRYTALILKVAGIILILGVLLDYIVLAFPANFLDNEWIVNLINQWVGRGTVPLLGIAFIVFGIWIERISGDVTQPKSRGALLTATLILSLLLGIIFLVFAPLHFNSSRLASAATTRKINDQAALAQQQLERTLTQQKDKVTALLGNEQQVEQLQQQLQSNQIPADQQAQAQQLRETLQKVKADPKLLDQELDKARTQGLGQIKQRQQQALDQAQSQVRNSRNQAVFSSLLLSVGYFTIGATGLRTATTGSYRQRSPKAKGKKGRSGK